MKKWEILLLLLLLLGAFTVRLYRFNGPIADWHSWRQADTAAVSRNFVTHGFDLLHPTIDNISNVQTDGKYENPKGYFFAEFPLYNALQAGLFVTFHYFTLEEWGRLVTIFSSLVAMVFLYLLCRKYANRTTGFFAVFFYAFLPFAIYYSRTILPQSSMTAALLGGIYFFDAFLSESKNSMKTYCLMTLGIMSVAIALLVSPYALFFFTPFLYLAWKKWSTKLIFKWQVYISLVGAILPFVLWRVWMQQYPEGIPSNWWLLNGGNIRFTGSFFYWLFAERLGRLLLGYWGLALLVIGIVIQKKNSGFFYSFLISSLLYMTVIARGNIQHDYYQLIIIPSVAMFLGLGANLLCKKSEHIGKYTGKIILSVVMLFSIIFSWYYVRDFFNINNPSIVAAGKVADALLPKNAKVITFYNGDSTFLYQINRQGWASLEKSLPDMIKMGANYVVIVSPTPNDFSGFGKQYQIVAQSSEYLIVNLNKPL